MKTITMVTKLAKKTQFGKIEEHPEKLIERTWSLIHPDNLPDYAPKNLIH